MWMSREVRSSASVDFADDCSMGKVTLGPNSLILLMREHEDMMP